MGKVNPGFNPQVKLGHLRPDEKQIVNSLSREWYITHGGFEIRLGRTSIYRYCLVKPVDYFQQMFNVERELIVLFSPYQTFEPRTLDALDIASGMHASLRVERICSVVVSRDPDIESRIRDLVKSDPESPVVVPFSYKELMQPVDFYFMRNRFKEYFYTRDLFAFEGPLKKALYFFGRTDLVHRIVNRHLSGENSGLMGLRKTGKTSVIFGVSRTLAQSDGKSVFVDCQNPAFHRRRWYRALHFTIAEACAQNGLAPLSTEDEYTEEDAPILFEKELTRIHEILGGQPILFIFDEIENITFNISPTEHWRSDLDFIFFWQTLRSLYQKLSNVFTYLIVGTNPMGLEKATVHDHDNPIFNQVPFEYLPGFTVAQTEEMVRKLGKIMGLKFDATVFARLTDDFGGHPFLMRHVCSVINRISPSERPTRVDKTTYENAKALFCREYGGYIEMVVNVLRQFYEDEYAMLGYLARGDGDKFHELAAKQSSYTSHLVGYGILEKPHDKYVFKTEVVREYLAEEQKYQKLGQSAKEMWSEVSERRNALEPRLRQIIRGQLLAVHGKVDATKFTVDVLGGRGKSEHSTMTYDELFDPNICKIYFDDLRKLVGKNWDCFKNILGPDGQEFHRNMRVINSLRIDAHAKTIHQDRMSLFRIAITQIEKQVEDFLG